MKLKQKASPSFKLTLLLVIGFSLNAFSQQEHAWVYFNDKPNSDAGIDNPISILTQKAIARKQAHNVAIDFRDVPVDESYISEVKAQIGVTVLAKSKWFNSVHVIGTEPNIRDLLDLSMVREVIFADRSLNFRTVNAERSNRPNNANKFTTENRLTNFDYGSAANQIEMLKGDYLHLEDFTGEGMTIAVIDAGFTNVNTMGGFARLRNNGKLLGGYDFVNRDDNVYAYRGNSHGTLVLSCMAGYIESRFVGTAPDASYYLFRSEKAEDETPMEESLWVEAVERADSLGVDLINTSLGYKDYDNSNYSYSANDLNGDTAFITKGANMAFEKGMLLVNSAGNSGTNGLGVPADAPGVLSIAAVDSNGNYVSFSSQGSAVQATQKPDVAAQGRSSAVINQNNSVTTSSGTSFSSPILAGSVACLWQALPNLSNGEIMTIVRQSASQFDSPDFKLGFGIPDFEKALAVLSVNTLEESQGLKVFPNPATDKINIKLPKNTTSAELELFDVLGQKVLGKNITENNAFLNTTNFSKGMYFLHFNMENSNKTIKVILK